MTEIMEAENGIGLATSQVRPGVLKFGYNRRIFISKATGRVEVFINPKIISESDEQIEFLEGCLSFDDILIMNRRPKRTVAAWFNEKFEPVQRELVDLESVVFHHEFEHTIGLNFMAQHRFSNYEDYRKLRNMLANGFRGTVTLMMSRNPAHKQFNKRFFHSVNAIQRHQPPGGPYWLRVHTDSLLPALMHDDYVIFDWLGNEDELPPL
jgi:peptide deformylase